MNGFLGDLNEDQREAVTSSFDEPLFIFAGAGSGKTRTLISRISHMINTGIDPASIMAMTFTRKAAEEIKDRLRVFIGPKADAVVTTTYHQLCLSIIRSNPFILNTGKKDFHVADANTQRKIVRTACSYVLNITGNGTDPDHNLRNQTSKMLNFINRAKLLEMPPSKFDGDATSIYKLYEQELKNKNMIDFHDFLAFTKQLFIQHPRIAHVYHTVHKYILIDEFQDTSDTNFEILRLILNDRTCTPARLNNRVTIVGDPRQSIYSFRGANPNIQSTFYTLYPKAKKITLRHNYRSTQTILKASQSLISRNENDQKDDLISMQQKGDFIKLIVAPDAVTEAEEVCKEIEKIVYPGSVYQYRDITVMFRMRRAASELELELFRRAIPYNFRRGISFFMRLEVREVISYVRLVLGWGSNIPDANGQLFSSFEMILNTPDRGIRVGTLSIIRDIIDAKNITVLQLLKQLKDKSYVHDVSVKPIPKATVTKLVNFASLIDRMHRHVSVINQTLSVDVAVTNIIEMSGLKQKKEEETAGDIEGLEEVNEANVESMTDAEETLALLIEEANRFHMKIISSSPAATIFKTTELLRRFIDSITLEGTSAGQKNSVTLSTIHQMKGKESPICFILRFNQGVIPMDDGSPGTGATDNSGAAIPGFDTFINIEEERRIAYVAMTRAKVKLFISLCKSARGKALVPSMFLDEIDQKCISRDLGLKENEKRSISYLSSTDSDEEE